MVNQLEEGVVQLFGKGMTHKPFGRYLPGEYEELTNLDISDDGTLRSRNGFTWARHDNVLGPLTDFPKNFRRFIGSWGASAFIGATDDKVYLSAWDSSTGDEVIFPQTAYVPPLAAIKAAYPIPGGYAVTNESLTLEGLFYFNGILYYIYEYRCDASNGGGAATRFRRRQVLVGYKNSDVPSSQFQALTAGAFTGFVSLELTDLIGPATINLNELSPKFYVKNHLMFRTRAWVATLNTVYFSKLGDPSIWAAPDGGFIKFPDEEIKKIYPMGDLLYVITDSRIYVITYQDDFNTDGEVILISPEVGGEDICSIGDTLYVIKDSILYSIVGMNVTRLLELDIQLGFGRSDNDFRSYVYRIGAFDNCLYFFSNEVRGTLRLVDNIRTYSNAYYGNPIISESYTEAADTYFKTPLFKLNLSNGSMSRVDFVRSLKRSFNAVAAGSHGIAPTDVYLNSVEGVNNQSHLRFLHSLSLGNTGMASVYSGYCVNYPVIDRFYGRAVYPGVDRVINPTFFGMTWVGPDYWFKIKDFSPDNFKYLLKKFRTLNLELNLHKLRDAYQGLGPRLMITYGNGSNSLGTPQITLPIVEQVTAGLDDSRGFRFPLNQRARFISFEFNSSAETLGGVSNTDLQYLFELSDLRVLWSPTQRSVVSNTSLTS